MVNKYTFFTEDDTARMLLDIQKTVEEEKQQAKIAGDIVGNDVVICPVGWGAARDLDYLETLAEKRDILIPHVRYDLSQSDDIWFGARRVTTKPHAMRHQLENGLTRKLTQNGIRTTQLPSPLDFEAPLIYIIFDDWTTSGLSLSGGEFFVAYNADELSPYAIYGSTLNDQRGSAYFSVFKGYEHDGKPYLGSRGFFQSSLKHAYDLLESRGTLRLLRSREWTLAQSPLTLPELGLTSARRPNYGEVATGV